MFRKAERKKAKLRLGIMGASGSGKTWSALEIAFGMASSDKIFFIDTESGRGELYQGEKSKYDTGTIFDYNYCRLDAPYSPDRYIAAMKEAETAGCEVLIIDSLSHAWSGEGGVLSIVEKAGGQFNGWRYGTPKQNALIDAIIQSKMHIICNLRSKTEYVVEKNEQGKHAPRKIGLAPVQRPEFEYEFTLFMNMNQEHIATVIKDNTDLFIDPFIKPSSDMGRKLMEWLNKGIEAKDAPNFMEEVLPDLIIQLNECQTLNDLRKHYEEFFIRYQYTYSSDMPALEAAKNKRKDILMDIERGKAKAPRSAPIIETASAYSNTLNQVAQSVQGV